MAVKLAGVGDKRLRPNVSYQLIIKTERAATRDISRITDLSLLHNSPSPMRNIFIRSVQHTALATCLHSLSRCQ